MFPLQFRFRIVEKTHHPGRLHRVAIGRGDEKIDLQGACDVAHEIAEENKTAFQQSQHEQITVRIGRRDLRTQFLYARVDDLRAETVRPRRQPGRDETPARAGDRRRPQIGGTVKDMERFVRRKRRRERARQIERPLEIPPDLTAPQRDDRFAVPDVSPRGVATYSAYSADRAGQPATA